MHPLIARFIDLPAALTALEKEATSATVDSEEAALMAAGAAFPRARAAVLEARGSKNVSAVAQQQLIVLATRAATLRISVDPVLGPLMTIARAALKAEGASESEAADLIAQAVLEEAFGYAEDPEVFDASFLAETLASLAFLARVTQESIDDWLEVFARGGPAGDREGLELRGDNVVRGGVLDGGAGDEQGEQKHGSLRGWSSRKQAVCQGRITQTGAG